MAPRSPSVAGRSPANRGMAAAAALLAATCAGACGAPPASTEAPAAIGWERVDPLPDTLDGPGRIIDTGPLLVGTGTGGPWSSEDGRSWTRGEVDAPAGWSISSVAVGPAGGPAFVGVGRGGGMGTSVPLAFASIDGRRWSSVASRPGLDRVPGYEQAHLDLVACRQAGCVAAGTEWGTAGQRPFVLVSGDGRAWQRTPAAITGSGARALVATSRGFLLAGAANAPAGQPMRAAFWVSGDGRTWEGVPDIPAFANAEPQAIAVGQEIVVAVGCRFAATGLAPAAWTSADDRSWVAAAETPAMVAWPAGRPTPLPVAMSGTEMRGVARVPGGFVAVGSRFGVNPAGTSEPGGEPRLTVQGVAWQSPDGVAWDMLPDDPLLPLGTSAGARSGGLTSIIAREDRVIAAGVSGADGVLLYFGQAPPRP